MFRKKVFLTCLVVGMAALYRGYMSQKEKKSSSGVAHHSVQEVGEKDLHLKKDKHSQYSVLGGVPEGQQRSPGITTRRASVDQAAEDLSPSPLKKKDRFSDESPVLTEMSQDLISELETSLSERLQFVLNSELDPHAYQMELEACLSDAEIPPSIQGICKKYSKLLLKKFPELQSQVANRDSQSVLDEHQAISYDEEFEDPLPFNPSME